MISVTALCIIMGGACLLYYLIMFFYTGRIGDFAWFWLLNAAVFLSATWLRSLTQSWSRVLAGILLAAEGIGILLVVILGLTILSAARTPEPENMEYYLVLGAWVNGRQPSRALRKRLDKALSCAEKDPAARLILSGELSPVKYHGIVRIRPVVSRRVLSSHCHSFSFRR